MMILSEERQSHLAHLIVDGLWKDDLVDYSDDDMALRLAKRGIAKFASDAVEIDKKVREKIASLSRGVTENSSEWDVLYSQYFEEEMVRRGTK